MEPFKFAPRDIFTCIMDFMSIIELFRFASTCKTHREIAICFFKKKFPEFKQRILIENLIWGKGHAKRELFTKLAASKDTFPMWLFLVEKLEYKYTTLEVSHVLGRCGLSVASKIIAHSRFVNMHKDDVKEALVGGLNIAIRNDNVDIVSMLLSKGLVTMKDVETQSVTTSQLGINRVGALLQTYDLPDHLKVFLKRRAPTKDYTRKKQRML
jgi:hypothetical protein